MLCIRCFCFSSEPKESRLLVHVLRFATLKSQLSFMMIIILVVTKPTWRIVFPSCLPQLILSFITFFPHKWECLSGLRWGRVRECHNWSVSPRQEIRIQTRYTSLIYFMYSISIDPPHMVPAWFTLLMVPLKGYLLYLIFARDASLQH